MPPPGAYPGVAVQGGMPPPQYTYQGPPPPAVVLPPGFQPSKPVGHHFDSHKWRDGSVVVFESDVTGKSLRIGPNGVIDGHGARGPWAQFQVHRVGPDIIKLQNIGNSSHWLRINAEGVLDGHGSGGQWCELRLVKVAKHTVALRSTHNPNAGVGLTEDGHPADPLSVGFGPRAQFRVTLAGGAHAHDHDHHHEHDHHHH